MQMTYPRAHLINPNGGMYHLSSRCVRRAFLCGVDHISGRNFEHRKNWIEKRMYFLSELFAVDLFGYAVMSNHYHLIIRVVPERVETWTDEEVADRWLTLSPRQPFHPNADQIRQARKKALLSDFTRLSELRERLSSISWFMRYLNEPIARRANREDGCKGKFWESRFQSQELLDAPSLITAMVYVDLNPARAGAINDLTDNAHTSLSKRIKTKDKQLTGLNPPFALLPLELNFDDYLQLVRTTALNQRSKRPITKELVDSLTLPNGPNIEVIYRQLPTGGRWQRVIGLETSIRSYAERVGLKWVRTYT